MRQSRLRWLLLILLLQGALAASLYSVHLLQKVLLDAPGPYSRRPGEDVPIILKKIEFQNDASLKAWEEKVFKGKTRFSIGHEEGKTFLISSSQDASSGLYVKVAFEISQDLILSWRWRPVQFPKKKHPEKLSNKSEDDFAARIYVIFPGSNFFNTDVIEYIWDESLPVGTLASSPYSGRIQLYVIRSGAPTEENAGWQTEERNVFKDYETFFKKKPSRALGAIALMSDSDNTGTGSEAYFGDFIFKTKKKP